MNMEICIENVKEISMVTKRFTMTNKKDDYTDLLRISNGWISYRKNNFHTGKEMCSWSYKTSSKEFLNKYSSLMGIMVHEVNKPYGDIPGNFGSFNVRVTFKDDTHVDIHGTSNFYDNKMHNLAEAFLDLIPIGEEYSDFLKKCIFSRKEMNRKVLSTVDMSNIIGLMYAEGGAMGRPGHTEIIDEDYTRYVIEDICEKCDVTQMEVTDMFEGFKHRPGYGRHDILFLEMTGGRWVYLNLGMGNHLYLREDFYHDIGNQILDTEYPNRYRKWMYLIGEF